jgi:hypothetical protein
MCVFAAPMRRTSFAITFTAKPPESSFVKLETAFLHHFLGRHAAPIWR